MTVINVHVQLTDFFSRMVPGLGTLDLQIAKGARLSELLAVIAEQHNLQLRQALVDRNGFLHPEIAVVLDHQFVSSSRFDVIRIKRDCRIKILPLVSGG